MYRILIIIFVSTIVYPQDAYFKKINDGSTTFFKIGKIFPNPMSNPSNVFTNINIPDTSYIEISIVNSRSITIYYGVFPNQTPGEYQFSWSFKDIKESTSTNHYYLIIKAHDIKNNNISYSCSIDFFLINVE